MWENPSSFSLSLPPFWKWIWGEERGLLDKQEEEQVWLRVSWGVAEANLGSGQSLTGQPINCDLEGTIPGLHFIMCRIGVTVDFTGLL